MGFPDECDPIAPGGCSGRIWSGWLYTGKCEESGIYPSNLHDCHPILGRQHESTADGGNGGVLS